jgi:hypothetical protein
MSNADQQFYDAAGNPVDPEAPRMVQLSRKDIRRLEKLAEEGRTALAENEQLKRERAFVQAGIPLQDKRAAYFIAGYQGEQTPEAIQQEWTESFGGGSPGNQDPFGHEVDALNRANEFASSGLGTPPPDKLAERDAKLRQLSPTDPAYDQKFQAIFAEYGGVSGSMHN